MFKLSSAEDYVEMIETLIASGNKQSLGSENETTDVKQSEYNPTGNAKSSESCLTICVQSSSAVEETIVISTNILPSNADHSGAIINLPKKKREQLKSYLGLHKLLSFK